MADEKKTKKSKKKEKVEEAVVDPEAAAEEAPPTEEQAPPPAEEAPPPEPEPAPEPAPAPLPAETKASAKRKSGRDSKKAVKGGGSNIFDNFTTDEIDEFKAGFQFMDMDKDGIISKDDLRACMDSMGRVSNEKELDAMIAEASGPINFTQLLTLFFTRMNSAGDGDDPETVNNAFRCYEDKDGFCDALKFRDILMSGDSKFSDQEADNALGEMDIENGRIDITRLINMLTGAVEEAEA